MMNKHIVDQTGKILPSFLLLLLGLQREKTTSIFLREIENSIVVPVMNLHILSLSLYHLLLK